MTTEAEFKVLFEKGVELNARAKSAKARETEIARVQVKARVQAEYDERNAFYAALVDDHGFTIAAIGRIMGTTNRGTMKDAVEAGRAIRGARPAPVDPTERGASERQKYAWDAKTKTLTASFTQDDFKPYLAALPVEPSADGEEFTFTYDGEKLLPTERDYEHPVVAVMMHEKSQKEAIAFIEQQKEK